MEPAGDHANGNTDRPSGARIPKAPPAKKRQPPPTKYDIEFVFDESIRRSDRTGSPPDYAYRRKVCRYPFRTTARTTERKRDRHAGYRLRKRFRPDSRQYASPIKNMSRGGTAVIEGRRRRKKKGRNDFLPFADRRRCLNAATSYRPDYFTINGATVFART